MSITCDLEEGLDNQLFMICNLISRSLEHNKPFWFNSIVSLHTFFSNLKEYVKDKEYEKDTFIVTQENINQLSYFENVILQGYFQTPFFEKYDKRIYDLLGIDEKKKILKKLNIGEYTSIHFSNDDYGYYKKAIETIQSKKCIYFENTQMIQQLKKELNVEFVSCKQFQLCDWEEMILMSLCSHNIISNTFSWWGAYFNSNENKKVVYSEKWVGFDQDMFPSNWIKI